MPDSNSKPTDTITLENPELTATVRLRGAELCSLRDRATGEEFIWQNPTGEWAGSSPILFPFVGRVRGGGFVHAGQRYAMDTHGFANRYAFDSCSRNASEASLGFSSNRSTLQNYPFEFTLQVEFALHQRSLQVRTTVTNRGNETMHFSVGAHPAFALPNTAGPLSDWRVVFDTPEREEVFRLATGGELLATTPEPIAFAPGNAVVLSDSIFERDALIFKHIRSRSVALVHQRTGQRIVVNTGGAPHLGLWARPGAHYVCIEPWWGVDDDAQTPLTLAEKPAIQHLAPQNEQRFEVIYAVRPA